MGEQRTARLIGADAGLLCHAVTILVHRNTRKVSVPVIQRHARVGFIKASRLLLLMDDYGITEVSPGLPEWQRRFVTGWDDLEQTVARLREIAAEQDGADVPGAEMM